MVLNVKTILEPLIILDHPYSTLVPTQVVKMVPHFLPPYFQYNQGKKVEYISHQIGQIGHVDVL